MTRTVSSSPLRALRWPVWLGKDSQVSKLDHGCESRVVSFSITSFNQVHRNLLLLLLLLTTPSPPQKASNHDDDKWTNADWKAATSTADKMDLSSIPSSDVYLGLVEYKVKPGKAMDFAKLIDATQGQFYRHQPGCIAYVFGISSVDKDAVLATAIWSSKEFFYSLPKNPKDLKKLNDARAPYKALVEDMRIAETNVVFGVGNNKHPEPAAGEEQGTFEWDEVMGTYGRRNVVPNIPESNVYVVHVEMKAQPGKGEEVAKGLEATQGRFYHSAWLPRISVWDICRG